MRIKSLMACIILSLFSCISLATSQLKKLPAPLFHNLGNFHHVITTQNPLAQRYFDQGLILLYSFEYGEAIRSFQAAIKEDPSCAMCYWGLSLALGSKTDMPLNGHELIDAKNNIQLAMEKVDKLNRSEYLYVAALAQRYTNLSSQKMSEFAGLCSSYSPVSGSSVKKYALAMKKLINLLPDDSDAKTLYAASLFDLTGWNFWAYNGKPNPYTLKTVNVLESALKISKNNPGANHLYVHIIEWSPYPKKALPNAERLSELVPGSEHLAHMPCHTYYSVGRYHDATVANQKAIQIYKHYVADCKAQGFEPEIQYLYYHNYDYLVTAASMEGRKQLSISIADELDKLIEPLVQKNSALQKMLTDKILMRVRFGDWEEILKMPQPSSQFQYTLGIWYFAQGVAELQLRQLNAAKKNLIHLQQIIKQGPINANLSKMGYTLLQIADYTLESLIADNQGKTEIAIAYLKKAIQHQDTFTSADPPPWYVPERQLLGMLFLKAKKYSDAKQVFLEDLQKHPHNGWSLYGLAMSLRKLGNIQDAKHMEHAFKTAWKYSDISHPVFLFH